MPALRLEALRTLQRLIGRVNAGPDLPATLRAVADGVLEGLGFRVAAVSLVHDDESVEVVTVAGPQEVSDTLLGSRSPLAAWIEAFGRAEQWGQLRFESHEVATQDGLPSWVPDVPASDDPDAWHPLDALYAPLHSVDGDLVGVLSVDLPADGRRPGAVQRELLEMFAVQAGIAIDNARLSERLRASEASFRLAFENAPVGMSIVDFSPEHLGRFRRVNEAMCRMLGYSRRELSARGIREITHPDDQGIDDDILRQGLAGGADRFQVEKRYLRADGTPLWVSLHTSVVRDSAGTALYAISQFEDVSDRRAEQQELARRARLDPLTGLLNRSELDARVRAAITEAADSGEPGALLFCDLDEFKPVNDDHGHAMGDQVLSIVARRLQGQLRSRDTVARFGGDEFVILAAGFEGERLDDLVARLRETVAAPMEVMGLNVALSVTVGRVAITGTGGETPAGLIAAADADMYARKTRRRAG